MAFAAIFWVKLLEMFATVMLLKYAQTSDHTDIFIKNGSEFYSNNTINLRFLTPHIYAMLYPQNGDRIVAIDSVTSLHRTYAKLRKRPIVTAVAWSV